MNTSMRAVPTGLVTMIVIAISAGISPAAQVPYTITDLGTIAGSNVSRARDINNHAQVVGIAYFPGPGYGYHAFLWDTGTMTDLGPVDATASDASAINDAGQVVGVANTSAYLWEAGLAHNLGLLDGTDLAVARDINTHGQIVGYAYPYGSFARPFLYENGEMTELLTYEDKGAAATVINDLGQVFGSAEAPDGLRHIVRWDDGIITDLGTLGGAWSYALGANNTGQVVGVSRTPYSYDDRPFLYTDGGIEDLGTLGGPKGRAEDINDVGEVVGWSEDADGYSHATLWWDSAIFDLNELLLDGNGWSLSEAGGINDFGQIVGMGINPDGQEHAFLLTPIPEPATLSLLALGVWGLIRNRRKA